MNRDQLTFAAASVLILLAGALAWGFTLRDTLYVDSERLDAIPYEIGAWEGAPIPVEDTVETILMATYNLQREYVHPTGDVVWLYVGYYGTERGGTPGHTPRACYVSHGWEIVEDDQIVRAAEEGLRANEYLVELEGERRLVLFWFQSFRSRDLLSTLALRLDHVVGQLTAGRGDGALIRVSTPIFGDDREAARARLLGFAAELQAPLDAAWPDESTDADALFGGESAR